MKINVYGNIYVDYKEEIKNNKNKQRRNTNEMNNFKKRVKERDKVCQNCGESETQLEIHHIFPLATHPELGVTDGNGILLCQKCHREYHKMYKDSETAENFAKYMKDGHRRF